jgi:4-amino-4-deoxychorismate lyase
VTLLAHWVNGVAGADIPATDRGFSFGDSLFETFRIHSGRPLFWERHLSRLERGLLALGIDCEATRVTDQLDQGLRWLAQQGPDQVAARLTVSRGPAQRGYRGSAGPATVVLQCYETFPWPMAPEPARITVCKTQLADQALLAGIKHGNRLEQVLAGRELDALDADEGLLCDNRGNLVCALAANTFLVRGGRLFTPPIETCGVAGTVRELIIDELAAAAGIELEVKRIQPADLAGAEELLLSNSVLGIRSVSGCDGHSFTSTQWGDTLREHLYRACYSAP